MLVIESAPAPKGKRHKFLRTFPSLNDYTNACRSGWQAGNSMKADNTEIVSNIAELTHQPRWDVPVKILFRWYEEDSKRDIDNVAFAKKFILDGLVKANVIENDNQKFVTAFCDEFYVDKERPRVEVHITPADTREWEQ